MSPFSEADISHGILEVAGGERLREKLRTLGRANAARISYKRAAREMLEFYRSVDPVRPAT